VEEAAAWFARGLAIQPEVAELHANLGEVLRLQKHLDDAIAHLEKALALDPRQADAWNSLGLAAYDQGRFEDAKLAHRKAIWLRPLHAAAHVNLGNALEAQGKLKKAAEALRTALRIEPDSPLALTNLARVLTEMGDPDLLDEAEVLCRRATAVAPDLPHAFNNLGNVLRLQGRLEEAMSWYRQAAQTAPRWAVPLQNIARLLQQRGNCADAARLFDRARMLDGNWARYHTSLGGLSLESADYSGAVGHYRSALEFDPRLVEAQHGLGRALLEQGLHEEAEVWLRKVVRNDPRVGESWALLARVEAERGEFDLSCEAARAALVSRPQLADAYWQLVSNLEGQLPDAEVRAIWELLERRYLPDGTRAMLCFALATVLDAQGQFVQAGTLLETANRLQASARTAGGWTYDPDADSRFVSGLIAVFTSELANRGKHLGDCGRRPVFVVGLPRSGTTLTEQILVSHPSVESAGELLEVQRIFHALPQFVGKPGVHPLEALGLLDHGSAGAAAWRYLERLQTLVSPGAVHIVDKTPDNIRFLGLIALLWPHARVVVCSRDLRDVGLSCWQTWFASISWANDWEHIAQRFAAHQQLLEHWKRTRPLEWLDVSYEDLVRDVEKHARRLIDFIGLEWHPACLKFYKTRRVVRTASLVQVRRPVHTRSVGRWRRYATALQPLFQALERHGVKIQGSS
jgi:tetratricopeptide (TPR) repeat protein